jgi:CspA family cold shock protein
MSKSSEGREGMRGTVKWFNDAKGFGFIEHDSGKDVFVHYSVIESQGFKTLKDGEEVLYEIKEGPKGFHAVRVQRVSEPQKSQLQPETIVITEEDDVQEVDMAEDAPAEEPHSERYLT